MNATELASIMFPFNPETDRVIFYGTTMAYSVTVLYSFMLMTCGAVRRCIPKRKSKEVPFAKLTKVIVEPPAEQKEHEITSE